MIPKTKVSFALIHVRYWDESIKLPEGLSANCTRRPMNKHLESNESEFISRFIKIEALSNEPSV